MATRTVRGRPVVLRTATSAPVEDVCPRPNEYVLRRSDSILHFHPLSNNLLGAGAAAACADSGGPQLAAALAALGWAEVRIVARACLAMHGDHATAAAAAAGGRAGPGAACGLEVGEIPSLLAEHGPPPDLVLAVSAMWLISRGPPSAPRPARASCAREGGRADSLAGLRLWWAVLGAPWTGDMRVAISEKRGRLYRECPW